MNHNETVKKIVGVAENKISFMNYTPFRYFVSSMLAGALIGFGILLTFTIGGLLHTNPAVRIIMGLSFAVALVTVVLTGTELFTGNNLIMTVAGLNRSVSWKNIIKLLFFSWFGNLAGALLLSFIYVGTGLSDAPEISDFFLACAVSKGTATIPALFCRGILCNFLVCIAVLITFKTTNDSAKILAIFLCLFAFVTTGFEHSVANMTVYGVSLIDTDIMHGGVSLYMTFTNLLWVSLGNLVGGGFILGFATWLMGKN